jgi:hypothetical protein
MFSVQQNWRRGQNRFCLEMRGVGWEEEVVGGRGAQTMYTNMTECMNNFKKSKKELQILKYFYS